MLILSFAPRADKTDGAVPKAAPAVDAFRKLRRERSSDIDGTPSSESPAYQNRGCSNRWVNSSGWTKSCLLVAVLLSAYSLESIHGSTDERDIFAAPNDFERIALQRAELHHLMQVLAQQGQVDEP